MSDFLLDANSRKSKLFKIACFLIIVVLIILFFYYYKLYLSKKNTEDINNSTDQTKEDETPKNTNEWLTYISEKFNYTIEYPKETMQVLVRDDNPPSYYDDKNITTKESKEFQDGGNLYDWKISVSVREIDVNTTLEEWIDTEYKGGPDGIDPFDKAEIIVDGYNAIRFKDDGFYGSRSLNVCTLNDMDVYCMTSLENGTYSGKSYSDLFNTIVNTFKFTE